MGKSTEHQLNQPLRAAVVGSGFGGLAAAIRLATAGTKVTVYEARDKPGGRAYVYQDKGYTFDAGPTVITAPHCIEELFTEAGRHMSDYVELVPVTPFYRLIWPGLDGAATDVFDYDGNSESMLRQFRQRSEADAKGYLRFVEYSRKVFEAGYTGLASQPFLRFWDMVKVAPQLGALRADRSVYKTVARFIKDDHLRQALSFHSLLVGGNPYETSSIYTLIHYLERNWGVYFPKGGTGALVRAMVKLVEDLGGSVLLNTPVTHINVQDQAGKPIHKVHTAQGNAEFDMVVSNSDLHHTYAKLYADEPRAAKTTKKLKKMDWSMSLFVLYFGTDVTYEKDVVHHSVIFGPRYKELLKEIFHGHTLPDDFSLYLHAPHLTDPSLAPAGGGSFYVLSPVPHLGNADLNWDDIAPAYAEKILTALEHVMPNLRQHVVTKRWITPSTFANELFAHHGSAFSVAPKLTQSAYFRPPNKDKSIPGLYVVGAGTHPGAGVPGVINGAKATMRCIAEDFGLVMPAEPVVAAPADLGNTVAMSAG
jgi:phytoene desaturase